MFWLKKELLGAQVVEALCDRNLLGYISGQRIAFYRLRVGGFRRCGAPPLRRELFGGLLPSSCVLLLFDLRQLLLSGFPGK